MDAATRKRKGEEVRTICLFFNTGYFDPDKTGVLYKFNIKISSSADVNDFVELGKDLHPTVTFFEQDAETNPVYWVSCGIIGGGSKLFVVPSEMDMDSDFVNKTKGFQVRYQEVDDLYQMRLSRTNRLHPLQFDFLNNKTDVINTYPRAPKMFPFVIPIQDKVYVLSTSFIWKFHYIEPSFEAYDTTKRSWEPLPTPPFFKPQPRSQKIHGYAVVTLPQDDYDDHIDYIIVSFGSPHLAFFSYNTRTREWKPVSLAQCSNYPNFHGEAVVVGDHIYAHSPFFDDGLRAFPFRHHEEADDFSLDLPFTVKGFSMPESPDTFDCYGRHSTTIGIIRDRLLCLVSTSYPNLMPTQFVLVSIVQICKKDPSRCDTIKSFIFGIPQEGEDLNSLDIMSCFALAPAVTSVMEQIEEGRNLKKRVVQDITDYDDVSSDMDITSYVM